MRELMGKKYPFIDTLVEEIQALDAQQRLLLDLKRNRQRLGRRSSNAGYV